MNTAKTIYVYWQHRLEPTLNELLGILTAQCIRNKEVFSFAFEPKWLKAHPKQMLDPDLQLFTGQQFTSKANWGLFLDSSPDRWGRKLMVRREAIRARKLCEKPHVLLESDYLLGVYDETRMGALRFKLCPDGDFLNNETSMAAPPWANLRDLEEACRHVEDDAISTEQERWLSLLIAPGSSLGGARPKASVTAPDGTLWIAKFPKKEDDIDISAWEYATMMMARDAGLTVSDIKLESFSKHGSTFLTKRFDRQGKQRLHFASAMTLLGKSDGDNADSGCSYFDIAEFISQYGEQSFEDLQELWRRIVFFIAVSNTDDHLRNHGFLLGKHGWKLSPAYDINPNPQGLGLSLNITPEDNSLNFDLALEVASFFRVEEKEAECILETICKVVSEWRSYAKRAGVSSESMEYMASAFRYE